MATDIRQIFRGLELADDGIWYARDMKEVSYPEDGHSCCMQVEEQSFWFSHRNKCVVSLIDAYPPPGGGPVFDVGGGNGFVAAGIVASGQEVVLIEPGIEGARNAKRRNVPQVVCATIESADPIPETLPAVGLFDVVEHVEDDKSFLEKLNKLIQPGGKIYITVPAYQFLWSQEDRDAGHFRRYSLAEICNLLEQARFQVDYATYFFRLLPLPIFLLRTLPWRVGFRFRPRKSSTLKRDHIVTGPLNSILQKTLAGELESIRHNRRIRFGGSCLVAATRAGR